MWQVFARCATLHKVRLFSVRGPRRWRRVATWWSSGRTWSIAWCRRPRTRNHPDTLSPRSLSGAVPGRQRRGLGRSGPDVSRHVLAVRLGPRQPWRARRRHWSGDDGERDSRREQTGVMSDAVSVWGNSSPSTSGVSASSRFARTPSTDSPWLTTSTSRHSATNQGLEYGRSRERREEVRTSGPRNRIRATWFDGESQTRTTRMWPRTRAGH